MTNWVESPCLTCAGPLAVMQRPQLGAVSSGSLVGLALAGLAVFGLFAVMSPKTKGMLRGLRSRRRRRSRR